SSERAREDIAAVALADRRNPQRTRRRRDRLLALDRLSCPCRLLALSARSHPSERRRDALHACGGQGGVRLAHPRALARRARTRSNHQPVLSDVTANGRYARGIVYGENRAA